MQKNLLLKTVIIVAVLLIFLGGIFGIPSSWNGEGLKQAVQNRIHLGLDLKGGTHLILQVMVNEAVSTQSDNTIEALKTELGKAHITYTDISKPDAANHPERIVIQGVSLNDAGQMNALARDRFPEYNAVAGAGGSWTFTMSPTQLQDLKTRTVDKSIEAIRRRVDALGVSEPVIQRNGMGNDQILVELPGVDDPGRVREIIQSTGRLELRESRGVYSSEQEALQAHGGLIPANMVLMHGKSDRSGDRNADVVYLVSRVPVASGTDIRDAREGTNPKNPNKPIVNFYLTASAAKKFAEFTERHKTGGVDPANLAIVLDNKVFSAPSIENQISDSGYIEGDFDAKYASDLAKLLQSGALPASLHYLTEHTVGPSLGADSIRSGVRAAVWGMVAVLVFMLIYYRGAGINADVALIFNLIILLGFLGWMNYAGLGATLTLPGIAGVILTVGMGVDSNVLIFERIREELRNNKPPAAAVDQGFSRAWITIVDTHVTTMVSAIILIFVGSGPVSGFGLTLFLGLLANLFTAVFVSRVIFDTVLSRKQRGEALSI
jgi:preprotein translocase subunit SecD